MIAIAGSAGYRPQDRAECVHVQDKKNWATGELRGNARTDLVDLFRKVACQLEKKKIDTSLIISLFRVSLFVLNNIPC